ncbi:MAG: SO_0444 family Cu/Zn efflux transporter [Thermoguttaceae bacterium]|jgi:uncharacterized membrane protein YraQ (UPF0718 family)
MHLLLDITGRSWLVLGEMAPYLLFGFAMAGLLSVLISPEWTERHLGGRGLRPVLEAAAWGIPLPLCSCSVIPVVASMRRHGASRAAATAFLLSTPQTGADSIAATYAMLGPVFAIFRPVAALLSGILGGCLVLVFGESRLAGPGEPPEMAPCTEACCTGDRRRGILRRAVRYGFVTMPRDLAAPLAAGILLAGAMTALVHPDQLQHSLGGGLVSILVLMAVGIPLYVCATASVPIARALIYLGASPGAALAFLIAGAATNFSTLPVIWKVLGRRTAVCYLLTVAASAVFCGLLLDLVTRWVGDWMPPLGAAGHAMGEGGWGSSLWAAALLAVLVLSYPLSRTPRTPAGPAAPAADKPCCCEADATHKH